MALKHHPDRHTDIQAKKEHGKIMAEINQAWNTLKDPLKRTEYDMKMMSSGSQHSSGSQSSSEKEESGFRGGESGSHPFYDSFKDVFSTSSFAEDFKTHQVQTSYSEKALFLFQMILENIITLKYIYQSNQTVGYQKIPKIKKQIEIALKAFLREVNIPNLKKQTLQRILNNFYNESSEKIIRDFSKIIKGLLLKPESNSLLTINFLEREKILYQYLGHFIQHIEDRYVVQNITSSERKAIELFHQFSFLNQNLKQILKMERKHWELLKKQGKKEKLTKEEKRDLKFFEKLNTKDIRVFRKLLYQLGLPGETQHDIILRAYIDSLKAKFLDTAVQMKRENISMKDTQILKAIKNIKQHFDTQYYENLKDMSHPLRANFLKSFPQQFLAFQVAMGATIYRQALTDPYFYGAEKNPEALVETLQHSLSPSGILSFYIFIFFSQQFNYRLYGLGRLIDGKSLFGKIPANGRLLRIVAPSMGLAAGFLASALFDDLYRDRGIAWQCVKQSFFLKKSSPLLSPPHIDSCEKLYFNWVNWGKLGYYAADAILLIVSAVLSHRLIQYPLMAAIRSTALGSYVLSRVVLSIGLRAAGYVGLLISLIPFMEIYQFLDDWVGQPIKERLTAATIKDDLINLNMRLETDFNDLPYKLMVPSSNLMDNVSNIQGKIKQIGYRFREWINIRSESYSQSARKWTEHFHKLFQSYKGPSQLIKVIFTLSHFGYGFKINNNSVELWVSDEDVNNNSVELWVSDEDVNKTETDWNELNTSARFSHSKILQTGGKKFFKNAYCPQVTEDLIEWSQLCKNSTFYFNETNNNKLFHETVRLIDKYLDSIPVNQEHISEANFWLYLGETFNEMFSSDPNYFVQNLSYPERLQLSKTLIKVGLYETQILSPFKYAEISKLKKERCNHFFPRHETNSDAALLYIYCNNPSQNLDQITGYCSKFLKYKKESREYKICSHFFDPDGKDLKLKISTKILSAGIYLLKDLISKMPHNMFWSYMPSMPSSMNHSSGFYNPIQPLLDLLKVYKKGEKYFILKQEALEILGANLDTSSEEVKELEKYLVAKNLVCGGDEKTDDFLFSAPQFFSISEVSIYNFDLKQYESMSVFCKNFANSSRGFSHDILFDRPVQSYGENYENLYLALENILKTNYSSSKKLTEHFQKLSQSRWDRKRNKLIGSLHLLTENYYKNMIHLDSDIIRSHAEELNVHYHPYRILPDISSFTGGLKGLEISLFQVNYWMNILKHVMSIGEQRFKKEESGGETTINQEAFFNEEFVFDKATFEKAQMEVLSLLQSYHDTYKNKEGPYLLFADRELINDINHIFNEEEKETLAELYDGEESRFAILQNWQKKHSDSSLPVLMTPDIILSHILLSSIPRWNFSNRIESFDLNSIPSYYKVFPGDKKSLEKSWKQLVYSVVFELNSSLNGFFGQLQPLQVKEDFENQLSYIEER